MKALTITRAEAERMDFPDVATDERIGYVTPGEVLREDFMAPLGLSARALARDLDVPPNRITEILNGERAISAKTALLLARRFGTSAEFWMNLQNSHDLELAREEWGQAADETIISGPSNHSQVGTPDANHCQVGTRHAKIDRAGALYYPLAV